MPGELPEFYISPGRKKNQVYLAISRGDEQDTVIPATSQTAARLSPAASDSGARMRTRPFHA